jgi:hypothetical protein
VQTRAAIRSGRSPPSETNEPIAPASDCGVLSTENSRIEPFVGSMTFLGRWPMAWLEKRADRDPISDRFVGAKYQVSPRTEDPEEAAVCLRRFKKNLHLVDRGRLEGPPGADLGVFLLSDGTLTGSSVPTSGRPFHNCQKILVDSITGRAILIY